MESGWEGLRDGVRVERRCGRKGKWALVKERGEEGGREEWRERGMVGGKDGEMERWF